LVATRFAQRAYAPLDALDKSSCRPDFAMLIYPWQLVDPRAARLADFVTISKDLPPTFLAHSHDDRAAPSLNSLLFYAALRDQGVPAELHVYENGGHGYGMRPVANSYAHTWPQRAEEWLRHRKLIQ
jgi:acetyl esterase/lipase